MSTANRPEDATQTAQEELHTNAGESVEVAHNSISQAEPSGTNDTAPARMEVASPETTSEACARILKGLAALKVNQILIIFSDTLSGIDMHALLSRFSNHVAFYAFLARAHAFLLTHPTTSRLTTCIRFHFRLATLLDIPKQEDGP